MVSDRQRIEVHTHFTGTPSECHVFALDEITQPAVQQQLRAAGVAPSVACHFLTPLTDLYNRRPAWLAHAHDTLDAAVAAAYFWSDWTAAMPDDDILRRLLALNRERAGPPG